MKTERPAETVRWTAAGFHEREHVVGGVTFTKEQPQIVFRHADLTKDFLLAGSRDPHVVVEYFDGAGVPLSKAAIRKFHGDELAAPEVTRPFIVGGFHQ